MTVDNVLATSEFFYDRHRCFYQRSMTQVSYANPQHSAVMVVAYIKHFIYFKFKINKLNNK